MIEKNLETSISHIRERQLLDSPSNLETNVWRKIHWQEKDEISLDWLGSIVFRSGFILSTLILVILLGSVFGTVSTHLHANDETTSAAKALGFDLFTEKPGLVNFTKQLTPRQK